MKALTSQQALDRALQDWNAAPFYKSDLVLGIDIGLEGIGVCVRNGAHILHAVTLEYDVPEAERLAARRLMRSGRHCRVNRRQRLIRLRALFAEHGLPWVMRAGDPWRLRFRATHEGLDSAEQLSAAIISCVAHRGYDYGRFNEEGRFPWGDSEEWTQIKKELDKLYLPEEQAAKIQAEIHALEWKASDLAEFDTLLAQRTGGLNVFNQRLTAYVRAKRNQERQPMRGQAFASSVIWEHLCLILEKNARFLKDPAAFKAALGLKPDTRATRERAIFFYHRKTVDEMEAHFARKVARCPYSEWLGLGEAKAGKAGEPAIRRFRLLEFCATRTVELAVKNSPIIPKVHLSEAATRRLLDWIETNPDATKKADIAELITGLKEEIKDTHGLKTAAEGKLTHNAAYFDTLRELLVPRGAQRDARATLCGAAATLLFQQATKNGYTRDAVNAALRAVPLAGGGNGDYYEFKKQPRFDLHGIYPQVEFLLGQRVRKNKTRPKSGASKRRGEIATPGQLQRLFARLLAEGVIQKATPDCAVVEVARDLPRNKKQKKEYTDGLKTREEDRAKLFSKYKLTDDGKAATWERVLLYDQQGGKCPYTGAELGSPLAPELQRDHLFPDDSGGLSINENLVLTHATTNAAKKKRTPKQWAEEGGPSWESMLAITKEMRWGKKKRGLFAWADPHQVPEFENLTRTSQLARHLVASLADWMGINAIPTDAEREKARRERIGTPDGFRTAACRRAWGYEKKDRNDQTHHLVDAVILAHIPPGNGLNEVSYGGIFVRQHNTQKQFTAMDVLPVAPPWETIAALKAPDGATCPVYAHRSTSTRKGLLDQTNLATDGDETAYRSPLVRKGYKGDADTLLADLHRMGIPEQFRPSYAQAEDWLARAEDDPAPLRLRDGSPVLVFHKDSNDFSTLFGFSTRAVVEGQGKTARVAWQGVRIFKEKFAAMELWHGFDKKNRPVWATQRRPAPEALRSLLYTGLRWFQLASALPSWPHGADLPEAVFVAKAAYRLRQSPGAQKLHGTALRDHRRRERHALLAKPRAQRLLRALLALGFDARPDQTPEDRIAAYDEAIWGKPLPADAKPGIVGSKPNIGAAELKKGDTFLLGFSSDGEISLDPKAVVHRRWFKTQAIQTSGKVKFELLGEKQSADSDGKRARKNALGLPFFVEKSAAADLAAILSARAPMHAPRPSHDQPPHPTGRKPRPDAPSGQTDLGF